MFGAEDHGESIYNIVPPKMSLQHKASAPGTGPSGSVPPSPSTRQKVPAPPTPTGRHTVRTTTPGVGAIDGNAHAKIGRDKSHSTFGLKSLAEMKKSHPESPHRKCGADMKLEGSSRQDDAATLNLPSTQTFVVANAVQAILSVANKVSKVASEHLQKEDYGKIPKYLAHIKNNLDAEYDYICQMEQEIADIQREAAAEMT